MEKTDNFFKKYLSVFGKKNKAKQNYLLALDIGTELAKAIIFKVSKEEAENGLIVGTGFKKQIPEQMRGGAVTDIKGVALTCQGAIEQAVKKAGLKPQQAIIGISGEFIKGFTTNFVYQRNDPQEKISLVELQNIIQKIQWRAFDKVRKKLAWETGHSEIEIKPLTARIEEVRIDGHRVTNPLGFQGKEIFLSIFNIYGPLVHLGAVENIASRLNLDLMSVVADPYALSRTSGFSREIGAIFIDIGGGTTDVALVRQGRIEGIKSFALAGRTFTKRLSQELGISFKEAEDIKIEYSRQEIGKTTKNRIRDILKKDMIFWAEGIGLALEEFAQGIDENSSGAEFFPSLFLICGGGGLLPGLKDILKREAVAKEWKKRIPFISPIQVEFLNLSQINGIKDNEKMLTGLEKITPGALVGLSIEMNAEEKKTLPSLVSKVIRIMR